MNRQQFALAKQVILQDATLTRRLVNASNRVRPYEHIGGLPATFETAPMCAVGGLAHAAGLSIDTLAETDLRGFDGYAMRLGTAMRKEFGLSSRQMRKIAVVNDRYDNLEPRRTAVIKLLATFVRD